MSKISDFDRVLHQLEGEIALLTRARALLLAEQARKPEAKPRTRKAASVRRIVEPNMHREAESA